MTTDAHDLLDALKEHESDWTIAWLIAHADPELWAPRQFIIVDELTKGSPTLAATWRAIYRLCIFYRPSGRFCFGLRMIADIGGVGRGHLSGTCGAIRALATLGLIIVTGMDENPRTDTVRGDRWEYRIDPAALEARSVHLIRSRLTSGLLVARRRPPEAQQRDLWAALDLAPADAILDLAGADDTLLPFIEIPRVAPVGAGGHGDLAPVGVTGAAQRHAPVPSAAAAPAGASGHGGLAPAGARSHGGLAPMGARGHGGLAPAGATLTPVDTDCAVMWHPAEPLAPAGASGEESVAPTGAEWHPPVPDAAPTGATFFPVDPHGGRERLRERGRERASDTHTPLISLSEIEPLIERALARQLAHLSAGASSQTAPSRTPVESLIHDLISSTIPSAPSGEPVLSLPLLTIWEAINQRGSVPTADLMQLKMLIERYREVTDGYSAYWVGRVMIFADMCRNDQEPIKIKLLNSYMSRMKDVGYSTETLEDRTMKGEKGATETGRTERRSRPVASDLSASAESVDHPAIAAYIAAFGRTPNAVQITQITETVTDNAAWQRVLTDWQANGWQSGGVAKMLDRYGKEAGTPVVEEQPVSVAEIYTYPDLEDAVRDRWVNRYHAATSSAEKRAVITRMKKEHPL